MAAVNTYRDWSVAATEDYPLISNIENLLQPQVSEQLFNVNPMENDIGDIMKMGLMEEVFGEEIIHHEKRKAYDAPYVNSSATVGLVYGTASVGNGDPAAFDGYAYIQLALTSHSPSTGDLAGTKSSPRVGEIINIKQTFWRIDGKRDAVAYANSHRLYIKKLKSTYSNLSALITLSGGVYGGDRFSIPSNAYEEATWGQQEGIVPTTKTYKSYITTFTERFDVTNKQMNNKTYPLYWEGKKINFWYEPGMADTEERFVMKEAMGLFTVPRADAGSTMIDPVTGNSVAYGTNDGYIPVLESNAPKVYYDDNPTLAMIKQISALRRKLLQSDKAMVWYGDSFGDRAADLIAALRANNTIPTDGATTNGRNNVELKIDEVSVNGYFYKFKKLRILSHPDFTDIPGQPYPFYFIVAPTGKTQDPKTSKMMSAFTILYKRQHGEGARGHYKIWRLGALAPKATSSQMKLSIHLASEKGIRVVGADRHILGVATNY